MKHIVGDIGINDKIRENRLRRMAARQGLKLCKSRRRDPKDRKLNSFANGSVSWQYPIIPLRELFVKENSHLLFDLGGDLATGLIDVVENVDAHP